VKGCKYCKAGAAASCLVRFDHDRFPILTK
jgi:hypothetical protein